MTTKIRTVCADGTAKVIGYDIITDHKLGGYAALADALNHTYSEVFTQFPYFAVVDGVFMCRKEDLNLNKAPRKRKRTRSQKA
jgi:hypothetical protein